jgi:hypothetical protein
MVSQLKSDTARTNGAKSRGPTTDEGKEKSSRNALKHGLTASNGNLLLDCEDRTQFDETFNKFLGIHEPANPAEKDLVEEMVAARWRIRRMWTIETGLFNAEILTQQSNPGDPDIHLSMAFRVLADDSRSLALANRYEARLQRQYDRSYKTLRELQQARKLEPPEQPQNFQIKWVAPQEEMDSRAEPADGMDMRTATADGTAMRSRNRRTCQRCCQSHSPKRKRGGTSGLAHRTARLRQRPPPKLPNEPTPAATKEVNSQPTPVAQAFVPVFGKAELPSRNQAPPVSPQPTAPVRNPSSKGL